jgi:hypothetical protein
MKPYALLMVLALVACSGSQPEQTANAPDQPAPQASQQPPAPEPVPAPVASEATQPAPAEASSAPSWDPEPAGAMAEGAEADVVAASQTEAPARPAGSGPRVFTNKDLTAYGRNPWVGSSRPPASASGTEEPYSEPEQDAGPQMTRQEINQYKAQVQQEITALTADLESLKKQAASLHNPFLPRATPNEQDKEAAAGKDGKQRLEYVNGRIEESQKRLAEAKGKMEQLDAIKPVEPPPEEPQN